RTIFGDGSDNVLNTVANIDFGDVGVVKVGNLACWEHGQPLLKYHTSSQHESVHISAWPPIDPHDGTEAPGLWSMSAEVYNQSGIDRTKTKGGLLFQEPGGGHSAVYGPDGRRLTKPLTSGDATAEKIVYTELDMKAIVTNRSILDVVGHYSRPDLLWLGVDKKQKDIVVSTKEGHDSA
ncbi:hypothetical protein FSARC_11078, partial [Fusarium sarcochroum]